MKINNFFFTVQATKKLKIKNQKIKILFAKHSFILKWIIKLIKLFIRIKEDLLMMVSNISFFINEGKKYFFYHGKIIKYLSRNNSTFYFIYGLK